MNHRVNDLAYVQEQLRSLMTRGTWLDAALAKYAEIKDGPERVGLCHDIAVGLIRDIGEHDASAEWFWCRGNVDGSVDHSWVDYRGLLIDMGDNGKLRVRTVEEPAFQIDGEYVRRTVQETRRWALQQEPGGAPAKLSALLARATGALPPSFRDRVVVFGSAPVVLAGLKSDVDDLDLFASSETFDALAAAGLAVDETKPGVPRIVLGQDIDVFKTWLGVTFTEVDLDATKVNGSNGFRVAGLRHVLSFKLARNADKDQGDIAVLRRALSRR